MEVIASWIQMISVLPPEVINTLCKLTSSEFKTYHGVIITKFQSRENIAITEQYYNGNIDIIGTYIYFIAILNLNCLKSKVHKFGLLCLKSVVKH